MNKKFFHSIFYFLFFSFISCSNILNDNLDIAPPDWESLTANGSSSNFYISLSVKPKCPWHKVSVYRVLVDINRTPSDEDFKNAKIVDKKEYEDRDVPNVSDLYGKKGRKYVYKAISEYMGGKSAFSSAKEILFYTPTTPTNVKAVEISSNTVQISWNSVTGAEYYKVYRNGKMIGEKVETTSFEDKNVAINAETYYTVEAYFCNSTYHSEQSSIAYIQPAPPTITSATANGDSSNFYISLSISAIYSWHKVSVYRAFVDINRTPNDADFIKIADKKEYEAGVGYAIKDEDVSISIGKKVVYKAKSEYMGGESDFSSTKEILFYEPTVPTNVKAIEISSNTVQISWNSVLGAEYYKIYRNGTIINEKVETTSFEDKNVNINAETHYTLEAYFCNSTYHSEQSSSAYIQPAPPTITSATANGDSSNFYISLSISAIYNWHKVSVYRAIVDINSTASDSDFVKIADKKEYEAGVGYYIEDKDFSDISSLYGKKCVYKAKSEYMNDVSDFSPEKEILFYTPTAPTNVKAVEISSNSVQISWDSVEGVDYYNIYKNGTMLSDKIKTTSFEDTNVSSDSETQYAYAVEAHFCNGTYHSEESYITICKVSFESTPPVVIPNTRLLEKDTTLDSSILTQLSLNKYKFLGWYLKGTNTRADGLVISSNTTLVAKWQLLEPSVKWERSEYVDSDEYNEARIWGNNENDSIIYATRKKVVITIAPEKSQYFDHYEINCSGDNRNITGNSTTFKKLKLGTSYTITVKEVDRFGLVSNPVSKNF